MPEVQKPKSQHEDNLGLIDAQIEEVTNSTEFNGTNRCKIYRNF